MARRAPRATPPAFPSREEIRRFIATAPGRIGKREIAREFGLHASQRGELRDLLKSLAAEGVLAPAGHRRFTGPGRLPEAMVVQVTGTDPDGEALARPVTWREPGAPPLILMAPEPRGRPALAPGERVLARLRPIGPGRYEGRTLKRLTATPGRIVGLFQAAPAEHRRPVAGRIRPADRRARAEWEVPLGESGGAEPGEIVLAAPLPHGGLGLKPARVIERLGRLGDASSVSLITLHALHIPHEFPAAALDEAAAARAVSESGREDLRAVPLITIDGADARDFDDAVFAEPDGDGFRLVVAIADVAHYVHPGTALDQAAWLRGNSVYFPDRVVPMLPEALSNHWCSLRPGEDRGCLFAELRIDAAGRKTGHRFGRGLMRSAARLTYEEVQHAADACASPGLPERLIEHLYGAFRALLAARRARGTLDLDLPEWQVRLGEDGKVADVRARPRLDSHRLIEEFMVLANVAAAEELERLRAPCVYRIHAAPSPEKLRGLRTFLQGFGVTLPPGERVHPRDLDRALAALAGDEAAPLANEMVLRSQAQAQYAVENIGHFGLGLTRYAHFTSPIRRYADLLVHRALIGALGLGAGALAQEESGRLADIAEHITATERRAASAERDAIERYLAAFMAERLGAQFEARISGVTRFGLFVTVTTNGANGIVPLSSMHDDFWTFDEPAQTLSGRRSGRVYRLAESVAVRLAEASPLTGGLVFHLLDTARPRPPAGPRGGRRRAR